MSAVNLHLALNHAPLFLAFAALVVFLLGMAWRNSAVMRAALITMVIASLGTIPVYFSGEPTEELVEKLDGVNAEAIEEHEDAGMFAIISMSILGVAALAALITGRGPRETPRWLTIVVLVIALWAISVVIRTAHLGGKIHHPELEMSTE